MSNKLKICLDIEPSSFQDNVAAELVVPSAASTSEIISSVIEKEYDRRLDSLMATRAILRYKPLGKARRLGNDAVPMQEIIEQDWLSVCPLDITVVLPKGSDGVEFVPPEYLTWGKDPMREELNVLYGYEPHHHIEPPIISHQDLKTIDKHRIKLWPVALSTEFITPIRRKFAYPCDCPCECMQAYIKRVWDWVVQFICRICGRTYLCECFRPAMEKFLPKAKKSSHHYSADGWPNRFIRTYETSEFREGLCHICRGVPSDLIYCSAMYRNEFIVRYGCYVRRVAIENDISEEEAENQLRDDIGIQKGEKWLSEIELYRAITELLPDEKVVHQARPEWLKPQTIDVYVPSLKLAIEYQGLQHYQPVEFFGGKEAFEKLRERDRRKAQICSAKNVKLIYFRYDEAIDRRLIKGRISKVCPKVRWTS